MAQICSNKTLFHSKNRVKMSYSEAQYIVVFLGFFYEFYAVYEFGIASFLCMMTAQSGFPYFSKCSGGMGVGTGIIRETSH